MDLGVTQMGPIIILTVKKIQSSSDTYFYAVYISLAANIYDINLFDLLQKEAYEYEQL
jgi:hypothetical protein